MKRKQQNVMKTSKKIWSVVTVLLKLSEEVTFLNFPLTGEKKTTKCNENIKENMKCSHCSFETKKISNLKYVQRFQGAS